MADDVAKAIKYALVSPNELDSNGEPANVVDALYVIGRGIHRLATAVEKLGLNEANTSMGAVELLAKEVRGLGAAVRGEEPEDWPSGL
jgi:hypothetical protein